MASSSRLTIFSIKSCLFKNFWVIAFHDFTNSWNKFVQGKRSLMPRSTTMHIQHDGEDDEGHNHDLHFLEEHHHQWQMTSERMWSAITLKLICVAIWIISFTRQFFDFANDWHEEVCFKVCFSPLHNGYQTF